MNKSLTSDRKKMDHCRPIALAQYKLLQLALVAAGYSENRFRILEPSCSYDLPELEERKEEWTELYVDALGVGVDLDTFPDVSKCDDLISASGATTIYANRAKASLTTSLTGSNNDLKFTCKNYGSIGNILQVAYIDPAANNQALAITVVAGLIRVSLATGAGGAITSTASAIKTAIEANANANALISVALATSNTGAGVVTAMAATNLTGGLD